MLGSIRLKYILLTLIISHYIVLTTSATTNGKLLLAGGIAIAALTSSSFNGNYSWSPIALLAAILVEELISTQSNTVAPLKAVAPTNVVAPTPAPSIPSASFCTAPGYVIDPVLGCIKFYIFVPGVAVSVMEAQCASDGGALIILNSAAEHTALVSIMVPNGAYSAVIQGSRVTATDPWVTDSGQPLPYIGSILGPPNTAGQTRLYANDLGSWIPFNPSLFLNEAVCEIA